MLNRKIDKKLESFFKNDRHAALLVDGARQVGKTFSIEDFGRRNYDSLVKLDFVKSARARSVFENVEDETDVLHMDVKELLRFPSFEELYRSVSLADCGYAAGETASPKDMDAFYTPEEQARWGVVAIRVAEPT